MKYLGLCAGVLLALCAVGAPVKFDSLSVGSKTYRNVTVIGANATDIYFTHSEGIANIKLKYLSRDLQKRFNYDPAAAAAAERRQSEDDVLFHGALQSNMVKEAGRAAAIARRAAASSESSLADPVSESSPLGKTAPALSAEQWIGGKPDLEGKSLLLVFWEPWSIPSRKCIADLNAIQKKFGDKLAVVGISADAGNGLQEAAGLEIRFPTAVDAGRQVFGEAGVTSVPSVLLTDAGRITRYVGHPAALNEKKLQALLGIPSPEEAPRPVPATAR